MIPLIECVPNISEGRRKDVIERIAGSLASIPGATLLDHSSDADHNRTVFTLVGAPNRVTRAIRTLFSLAIEMIDLRKHQGCHPRMGSVDVVPVIPIRGATMKECVELSKSVAEMISSEFGVPTYLYAESAASDAHRSLSAVRKGGFEGLAAKMQLPEWTPDFGLCHPHPSAGAAAVGARFFLIAYNIQLDTSDIKIAREVAKKVRTSSGGLPFVQAMGVYLAQRNMAQVSMNLLNYQQTPMHVAYDLVKAEAAKYGVRVVSSELVGLIPRDALTNTNPDYLQIENWRPELILENALESRSTAGTRKDHFLSPPPSRQR